MSVTRTKVPGGRRLQAGLTLIEAIIGLTVIAAATIGLNQLANYFFEESEAALAAEQLRSFGEATRQYVRDNYAAVQAVASPGQPALIDADTLVAAHALPTGYGSINVYAQATCALAFQPSPGKLQVLVVNEGGEQLGDPTLGTIALAVGGSGGGVYSLNPAAIQGTAGGWTLTLAGVDNVPNSMGRRCDGSVGNVRLETGRSVMALWFENGDTSSAFVARNAIPGRPELNAMSTPLVMNSVQVEEGACAETGAIAQDGSGRLLTCQAGQWKPAGDGKCVATTADLNSLQDDGRCFNGSGLPNSPAGADWVFVEVYRHYDKSTYQLVQRVVGMTGAAVGKAWTRTQNSPVAGGGWGAWLQHADPDVRVADGSLEAAAAVRGQFLYSSGNVEAAGTVSGTRVTSSGDVVADGSVMSYQDSVNHNGTTYNHSHDWGFMAYAPGWVGNAEPQSPRASLYVNDIYLRARGRWLSQSGGGACYWTGAYNLWNGGAGYCAAGYYINGLHGPYYHADTNVSAFYCCPA